MSEIEHLAALTEGEPDAVVPGRIEFTAYKDGQMVPACGDDHVMWTIAIDKDHTAHLYMHKDDYEALQRAQVAGS